MQTPEHSELPETHSHNVEDCLQILSMLEAVYDRQIQEHRCRIEQLKPTAPAGEGSVEPTVDFTIQPRRAA